MTSSDPSGTARAPEPTETRPPLTPVAGPTSTAPTPVTGPAADPAASPAAHPAAGEQPSRYGPLPDPELLLINMTRGVMEALAGVRGPEQLARWLSDAAYASVLKRVVLAQRARAVTKRSAVVPVVSVCKVMITQPNPGVVEAVLVVSSRVRARAVAIRLQAQGDRWIATSFNVL